MAETMFTADALEPEKIKTPFACIVVQKVLDAPYYHILWHDPETMSTNLGYSSYNIEIVLSDLEQHFDVDKMGLWYNEIVPIQDCDDCKYKGVKPSKCSCCRRNLHMKDCYESGTQPQREVSE